MYYLATGKKINGQCTRGLKSQFMLQQSTDLSIVDPANDQAEIQVASDPAQADKKYMIIIHWVNFFSPHRTTKSIYKAKFTVQPEYFTKESDAISEAKAKTRIQTTTTSTTTSNPKRKVKAIGGPKILFQ